MLINEWIRQEKNDYHLVSVDRVGHRGHLVSVSDDLNIILTMYI
jgi:hypothetical protein